MKTLKKSFILLFGLMILSSAHINAQHAFTYSPPMAVQMELYNGYDAPPYQGGNSGGAGMRVAKAIEATLTSNHNIEIAFSIYSYANGQKGTLLYRDTSGNLTKEHTFSYRHSTYDVDLYIECGYMEGAKYTPDSGCTVTIQPG